MGRSTRPQSQPSGNQQRGTDVRATRGQTARVRDQLKSDRDNTQSTKPAAVIDQFGSRHNEDDVKTHQRQRGRPAPGGSNLAFRESAQDFPPDRGQRNKVEGRRTRKSGTPRKQKGESKAE